jgi:hypothetical protein
VHSDVCSDISTSHSGTGTPRQFLEGAGADLHNIQLQYELNMSLRSFVSNRNEWTNNLHQYNGQSMFWLEYG